MNTPSAGLAYSNYQMRNSTSAIVNDKGEKTGFDMGRLLRSGIYIPISEALLMFYQVSVFHPETNFGADKHPHCRIYFLEAMHCRHTLAAILYFEL